LKSPPPVTYDLLRGDDHILECYRRGIRKTLPQFVFRFAHRDEAAGRKLDLPSRGESPGNLLHRRRRHGDDDAGHEISRRLADLAENGELGGEGGVGDEALGAVQQIRAVFPAAHERGHGAVVRTGPRFGQAEGGQKRRGHERSEEGILLGGGAVLGDDGIGQVVAHGRGGDSGIPEGEFRDDEGGGNCIQIIAFQPAGDAQIEDSQFPGPADDLERKLMPAVHFQATGNDLRLDEPLHRLHIGTLLR